MFDQRDPRTSGEYIRRVPGGEDYGDVIVTGVVHDHPASKYRVRSTVEAVDPDVLALEIPPLAVPLFERYAGERTLPTAGDEMSVAIRAADTETVVGIDGPSLAFVGRLVRNLYRRDVGFATVRSVLRGLASVTRNAVACRLAAILHEPAVVELAVDIPDTADTRLDDDPQVQADDEQAQIRKAESVLQAFGKSTSGHLRDVTRETHMADRISTLRREGSVVAVVGIGHLDSLIDHLE